MVIASVRQNGHLAMFLEEIPARLIKMFSFVGETVLDPYPPPWRLLRRYSVSYRRRPVFTSLKAFFDSWPARFYRPGDVARPLDSLRGMDYKAIKHWK